MKKYLMYLNNKTLKLYLIIAVLSSLIFCGIYGIKVLDPTYIDWLLTGGDLTQHYLGWDAYRSSDWHFPIGMVDTLAYPNYTSIIFTDSIPILAVFFKILSPILPSDFQYFGFWGIGCFILQGILTARIIKKYTPSSIIVVIVSCLFTLTPVMIWRMYAHTALAGQWILLLSLEIVFNKEKYIENPSALYIVSALIGLLSPSIHMYFVLMNGIILLGACILNVLCSDYYKHGIIAIIIYLASTVTIIALLGGFSSNMAPYAGGLGKYSFNLNGLFNPQGWSDIFKDLPLYGNGQYEGFAYLGAGNIILSFVSLSFLCGDPNNQFYCKENRKTIFILLTVVLTSIIIALSNVITLNDQRLITIPLPLLIYGLWSIFHVSGRIIWIAIYMIMLCNCIILCKLVSKRTVVFLLASSLLLQIYDIKSILVQKYETFSNKISFVSSLDDADFWNTIAKDKSIKHIVYYSLPDQTDMYSITKWALDNDKTVNNFYFARTLGNHIIANRNKALKNPSSDSIFIFNINEKQDCSKYPLHYYFIDGFIVGSVEPITGFNEISNNGLYNTWTFGLNSYISENGGQDTESGRILYPGGYSFGPYWPLSAGIWSITISGENISETTEVNIYAAQGNSPIEFNITEKNESLIKIDFLLDIDISDFEIFIKNNGTENIILKEVKFEYWN